MIRKPVIIKMCSHKNTRRLDNVSAFFCVSLLLCYDTLNWALNQDVYEIMVFVYVIPTV